MILGARFVLPRSSNLHKFPFTGTSNSPSTGPVQLDAGGIVQGRFNTFFINLQLQACQCWSSVLSHVGAFQQVAPMENPFPDFCVLALPPVLSSSGAPFTISASSYTRGKDFFFPKSFPNDSQGAKVGKVKGSLREVNGKLWEMLGRHFFL
jgi:hypothetical protein